MFGNFQCHRGGGEGGVVWEKRFLRFPQSLIQLQPQARTTSIFFGNSCIICRWQLKLEASLTFNGRRLGVNKPLFNQYSTSTPSLWKHQKMGDFVMFSGGIKVKNWLKMGWDATRSTSIWLVKQEYVCGTTQLSSKRLKSLVWRALNLFCQKMLRSHFWGISHIFSENISISCVVVRK